MKMMMLALAALSLSPSLARADEASDKALAKSQIWPMEQAIYAGRASGNMSAYINNTASGYMAWPPQAAKPMGDATLKSTSGGIPPTSKEKLTMEFVDLAVHGDTAVIYYRTHRTMRFDGTPVDESFETAHTWVRENGQWRVLGGMARLEPKR
jgi:ketosteroid isomerase-like protein